MITLAVAYAVLTHHLVWAGTIFPQLAAAFMTDKLLLHQINLNVAFMKDFGCKVTSSIHKLVLGLPIAQAITPLPFADDSPPSALTTLDMVEANTVEAHTGRQAAAIDNTTTLSQPFTEANSTGQLPALVKLPLWPVKSNSSGCDTVAVNVARFSQIGWKMGPTPRACRKFAQTPQSCC